MDKVTELKELMDKLYINSRRVFEKDSRLAGKKARKILLEMEKLIIPIRKDILSKMKSIPKKPRKNDNLVRK